MARRDCRGYDRSSLARPPSPALQPTLAAAVRALTGTSWEHCRTLIRRGKITVDGETVTDPSRRVRADQRIEVHENAPRADRSALDLEDRAIVYMDEHLVVVDKPAGISTVPFDEGERGTLVDRVRHWLHRKRGVSANAPLFVVHRIDKDTSGLLVFGRTWVAKRHLATLFRAHTIERHYLALVVGTPARDKHTIDSVLVENRGDGLRGSARNPAPGIGKRAITHVEVLSHLSLDRTPVALVRCRLQTGRTHQIRIHLSEWGHPLVGERVYIRNAAIALAYPRTLLHAHELGFTHPVDKARVLRFRRDPPEDFLALLARAGGELPS
jgi:23S rRNA pseudouridine1911/1915/1917 synthase